MTLEEIARKINSMNDALDPAMNLPYYDRTGGEPATIIDPEYVWNMATNVMEKQESTVVIENAFPDEYYDDEMGEEIRNYILELVCELLGEKWFYTQNGKNAIFDRD